MGDLVGEPLTGGPTPPAPPPAVVFPPIIEAIFELEHWEENELRWEVRRLFLSRFMDSSMSIRPAMELLEGDL